MRSDERVEANADASATPLRDELRSRNCQVFGDETKVLSRISSNDMNLCGRALNNTISYGYRTKPAIRSSIGLQSTAIALVAELQDAAKPFSIRGAGSAIPTAVRRAAWGAIRQCFSWTRWDYVGPDDFTIGCRLKKMLRPEHAGAKSRKEKAGKELGRNDEIEKIAEEQAGEGTIIRAQRTGRPGQHRHAFEERKKADRSVQVRGRKSPWFATSSILPHHQRRFPGPAAGPASSPRRATDNSSQCLQRHRRGAALCSIRQHDPIVRDYPSARKFSPTSVRTGFAYIFSGKSLDVSRPSRRLFLRCFDQ